MPRNIESLDDEPIPDGSENFAGGLNTVTPRAQLQPSQFRLGINTVLTPSGGIHTRRAWKYFAAGNAPAGNASATGMAFLEAGATKKLLAAFSTSVCKQCDGAAWSAAAGYAPANVPVAMVQGIDRLYVSDGTQNMRSWNGAAFTDLGGGATDAPQATLLEWGTSRLIAAGITGGAYGTLPDTIAFSEILDPSTTHWSAANRLRIGADGLPITAIKMWTKNLLAVFKKNRAYVVDITPTTAVAAFPIHEVPGNLGCICSRALCTVGNDVWFLSTKGVRSLSRILAGADQAIGAPISLPIDNIVQAIPNIWYPETSLMYFKGRVLLTLWVNVLPGVVGQDWLGGFAGSYRVLTYNKDMELWEGWWDWVVPNLFAVTNFNGVEQLVASGHGADVWYWKHPADAADAAGDFTDDNSFTGIHDIATKIGTRGLQFSASQNLKRGLVVEPEFADDNTAANPSVKCIPDEGAAVLLGNPAAVGRVPLTLLHQPPFRAMAFNFESASGKLSVRALRASAFLQTMPVGQ